MITINLLPKELREKEKTSTFSLPPVFFKTIVVILAFQVIFGFVGLYKKLQVGNLDRAWTKAQSQFKEINDLKVELAQKKESAEAIKGVLKRSRYWTDFFNKINQATPKGLWLNRLSIAEKGLVIEGSVFSFNKDQITLVNKFFDELKKDVFFRENFTNFSLDSVQNRAIKQYEVLDFILSATLTKDET